MNQARIQETARALRSVLNTLPQSNADIVLFRSSLTPLLQNAEAGLVQQPMEWRDIPGGWFFTEGSLAQYHELEQAFAEFRIELTGGDNPLSELSK